MNRILFTIPFGAGGIPIYGYGLMMMLGFALGLGLAYWRAPARGIAREKVLDLGLYIVVAGVIGARLLFVLTDIVLVENAEPIPFWRYFAVWEGGLTFQGGLLLALIVAVLFMRYYKIPIGKVCDVFAPGLALGTAFGRIGCFLNGCCFGHVCDPDMPLAVRFPMGGMNANYYYRGLMHNDPEGYLRHVEGLGLDPSVLKLPLPVHPAQLYSAAALIGLCVVLLLVDRFLPRLFDGMLVLLFFMLYSVARFCLELVRVDTPLYDMPLGLPGLRMGQIIALLCFVGAGALFLYLWRRADRKAVPTGEVKIPDDAI